MANDLIMRVGDSVFRLGWESDMAIALDVSEDAMKRWAAGTGRLGLVSLLASLGT